jgi:hypothetical protein
LNVFKPRHGGQGSCNGRRGFGGGNKGGQDSDCDPEPVPAVKPPCTTSTVPSHTVLTVSSTPAPSRPNGQHNGGGGGHGSQGNNGGEDDNSDNTQTSPPPSPPPSNPPNTSNTNNGNGGKKHGSNNNNTNTNNNGGDSNNDTTTTPTPTNGDNNGGSSTTVTVSTQPPSSNNDNNGGQVYSGGQATFYNVEENVGACGNMNSNDEMVIALDIETYGDENSVSQYCGKQVQITDTENGNVVVATVVDCCPTCENAASIDMSPAVFNALSNNNPDEGVFPITWFFL